MSESVSSQFAAVATSANTYQYTVTLTDNGPTPIGTFWFAWVPGLDFMSVAPTSIQSPAGWQEVVTHGGGTDGFAIQWVASTPSADIMPGGTLTGFTFTSTEAPADMLAPSPANTSFPTTTSFVYAGAPLSDAGFKFTVAAPVAPANISSAFAGILRMQPSTAELALATNQIETGQQTLAQFDSGLIAGEQATFSTLPALVTIDAAYGATPQSATLDTVAAATGAPSQIGGFYSATYLHNLGYSDPNVWTIMASQWGADPTSAFFQQYNSLGADFSDFISSAYQREFGFAPSAANLQTLVNDVPGVQALLAGGSSTPTPIQVEAGLYGYLLYVGQTTPSLPSQYATAANAFLQAAANGTANYGQELTQQFPAAGGTSVPGFPGYTLADPNVITVTSSDQLIDPGTGSFTIQFAPGASGDTLMLHPGGVDQISGFDPGTDGLDVRSLLSGTGLAMSNDVATLSGFLNVTDQGADALLRFDPTGQGGGSTVAVLQGLGSSVTGLDQLISKGAVRIT
jgi:hypothetical protein